VSRIVGHRDLSPDLNHDGVIESREWIKQCPSFDVAAWLHANPL
jgi:N-acetylmuramoyl-L-alanine amidase